MDVEHYQTKETYTRTADIKTYSVTPDIMVLKANCELDGPNYKRETIYRIAKERDDLFPMVDDPVTAVTKKGPLIVLDQEVRELFRTTEPQLMAKLIEERGMLTPKAMFECLERRRGLPREKRVGIVSNMLSEVYELDGSRVTTAVVFDYTNFYLSTHFYDLVKVQDILAAKHDVRDVRLHTLDGGAVGISFLWTPASDADFAVYCSGDRKKLFDIDFFGFKRLGATQMTSFHPRFAY